MNFSLACWISVRSALCRAAKTRKQHTPTHNSPIHPIFRVPSICTHIHATHASIMSLLPMLSDVMIPARFSLASHTRRIHILYLDHHHHQHQHSPPMCRTDIQQPGQSIHVGRTVRTPKAAPLATHPLSTCTPRVRLAFSLSHSFACFS